MLFLALLCAIFAVACSQSSPIVGQWEDLQTQGTVEFTRDGDVILKTGGYTVAGTYELVGSNVLKVRIEGIMGGGGLRGIMLALFGTDAWEYRISGDTMTITAGGRTSKLRRIGMATAAAINRASPTPKMVTTLQTVTPLPPTQFPKTTPKPSISLLSPKGGEHWYVGDTITITWTSVNISKDATIHIELYESVTRGYIIGSPPNTGSFLWTVTDRLIGTRLRIGVVIPIQNEIFRSSSGYITISSR